MGRLTIRARPVRRRLLMSAAAAALALAVLQPAGALAARSWSLSPTSVSMAAGTATTVSFTATNTGGGGPKDGIACLYVLMPSGFTISSVSITAIGSGHSWTASKGVANGWSYAVLVASGDKDRLLGGSSVKFAVRLTAAWGGSYNWTAGAFNKADCQSGEFGQIGIRAAVSGPTAPPAPTATPKPKPTPKATPTPTPRPTPTPTPRPTIRPTAAPSPTPTATATLRPTPTTRPTPTRNATPRPTASAEPGAPGPVASAGSPPPPAPTPTPVLTIAGGNDHGLSGGKGLTDFDLAVDLGTLGELEEWTVPAVAVGGTGLVIAIGAQVVAGIAWLPAVFRFGSRRDRRGDRGRNGRRPRSLADNRPRGRRPG